MLELHEKDGGVTIKVRVQPRAARTEIIGEHAGAIKMRVAAPPVDGKANEECRRYLAKLLKVGATSVEIISGDSSRDKVIRVSNISALRVLEALGR
ncbi:MAG TPA: DUF167 domain-containing protein [Blastocatellia bacterium]|nr:DUF167 domain-containing protein [Blastocatellia bacterium]